jgi:hypothetical protein
MERSPDNVIELDVHMVGGKMYFHWLFCVLGPCTQGFYDGCQSYLSVDSMILNGRWNSQLASAIGVDGHN